MSTPKGFSVTVYILQGAIFTQDIFQEL